MSVTPIAPRPIMRADQQAVGEELQAHGARLRRRERRRRDRAARSSASLAELAGAALMPVLALDQDVGAVG